MDTITIKTKRPMIIISLDEYEGMKETIQLLTKNPHLPRELRKERRKMEKGDFISFEDFRKKYKVKE
jgi:PHD/YefM family antitoxin component YafN of YafNO toxin-antitoxin module